MSERLNQLSEQRRRRRQRVESRRRDIIYSGGFDPTSIGVIGAWFDVAGASNAGPGLAFTLPNLLSANHATTSIDARKPTIGAASNGVPILICNTSALQVALHAAINGALQWGFSFHARITTLAGNPVPVSIDSAGSAGASTRKCVWQRFVGDNMNVHDAASPTTLARRFGPAEIWPLNTWVHCTCELNLGTGGAENTRGVMTVNGVPVVSTYVDALGAPGSLPTAMAVPTGFMNLLAQGHVLGTNSWIGEVANMMVISGAMSGVTSGLLTPAARINLSNFNRPA
jgi:hypothetical protein